MWALGIVGCRKAKEPGPLLLIVSVDTTRADALSCYAKESSWGLDLPEQQRPVARTPGFDALAKDGVRFAWALSHAPATLNSHTTIMSGLDPHGHRVVRNGFPVPDDVPLLAERLQAAGWDTIAVVGASVLESEMGLNRGFRVYDDHVSTEIRRRFEDRADRVVDRALHWVDDSNTPGGALALFVHFFDPHSPWQSAPSDLQSEFVSEEYRGEVGPSSDGIGAAISAARNKTLTTEDRTQARGYYLSEVAWVDSQFQRLMLELGDRGMLNDALVVVLSDHGETLEEIPDRPYGHTLDADLTSVHVPLIVAGKGQYSVPKGLVVNRQVRLMDVAPTLLSMVGVKQQLGEGQDLSPLFGDSELLAPPSFAEATKPFQDETGKWPNLGLDRSVAVNGYFLTRADVYDEPPALFALSPGQPKVDNEAKLQEMLALLEGWDAGAPNLDVAPLAPNTEEALKALGYLEKDD